MPETLPEKKPWAQSMLATSIVGIVLCCMAFWFGLLFVCLIPLQWVYYKTGPRPALLIGVLVMVLMAGGQLIACWIQFGNIQAMVILEIVIVCAMVIGLALLQNRAKPLPAWTRIILCYGVIVLCLAIMWLLLSFQTGMLAKLDQEMSGMMAAIGFKFDTGDTKNLWLELTLISLPIGLLVMVLINWYAATWFWRRRSVQWSANSALANFRIAEYMVWPLLFSLAGIGLGLVMELPLLLQAALSWVCLGVGFIYFLQGLGILAAAIERRRNPHGRALSLPLVCAILFTLPVINVVAAVAITLLGVLELWVRMRPATHA